MGSVKQIATGIVIAKVILFAFSKLEKVWTAVLSRAATLLVSGTNNDTALQTFRKMFSEHGPILVFFNSQFSYRIADFSKNDYCVDPKNLPEDYEANVKPKDDDKKVPGDVNANKGETLIGVAQCRKGGLQRFPFVGEDSAQRMLLREGLIDAIPSNLCNITDDPTRKRKNVILVVGDGMGWEMARSGAIARQVLDELESLGCNTMEGCEDNAAAKEAFEGRTLEDYYTEGKMPCL